MEMEPKAKCYNLAETVGEIKIRTQRSDRNKFSINMDHS